MTDEIITRSEWSPWQLNLSEKQVELSPDHVADYYIPLLDLVSSSEVLDWLVQILNKSWGRQALPGLLTVFDDLLWLQATMCPGGQDHRITKSYIEERLSTFASLVG